MMTTVETSGQRALQANLRVFDEQHTKECADQAPHLRDPETRRIFRDLLGRSLEHLSSEPSILDLGAGSGMLTLEFLRLGARVTAVDISPSQAAALAERGRCFGSRLKVVHGDINSLPDFSDKFDMVAMNSVLHHIPDYL